MKAPHAVGLVVLGVVPQPGAEEHHAPRLDRQGDGVGLGVGLPIDHLAALPRLDHVVGVDPQRWLPGTTHSPPLRRWASCRGTQTLIRVRLRVCGSSGLKVEGLVLVPVADVVRVGRFGTSLVEWIASPSPPRSSHQGQQALVLGEAARQLGLPRHLEDPGGVDPPGVVPRLGQQAVDLLVDRLQLGRRKDLGDDDVPLLLERRPLLRGQPLVVAPLLRGRPGRVWITIPCLASCAPALLPPRSCGEDTAAGGPSCYTPRIRRPASGPAGGGAATPEIGCGSEGLKEGRRP